MSSIENKIKEKFGYDVTGLSAYVDQQKMDILSDLIASSSFLSDVVIEEGVKGTMEIKLLSSDFDLASASTCEYVASGSIIFTGKELVTKRVYSKIDLCNETLNGTWAQMLNTLGASAQDKELPASDILIAYMNKLVAKKNQDLIFLGNTGSLDVNLQHYDGLIKQWNDDVLVPTTTSTVTNIATGITTSNAFNVFKELYNAIDPNLFDNGIMPEIIASRVNIEKLIANIYNDKDYASAVDRVDENGSLSITLPTTNVKVKSYPQMTGTDNTAYIVPKQYIRFGTDLTSDMDGMEVYFDPSTRKLVILSLFRSGIAYVFPQYFGKLAIPA